MAACAASSIAFRAAVAPRALSRKTTATKAASRGNALQCNANAQKINVSEVKDHLDRGFIIVDIRDPEECAETGYKSTWKNIVVRGARITRRPAQPGDPFPLNPSLPKRFRHALIPFPRRKGLLIGPQNQESRAS
jgi:hypothetical protein